ncbi:MAG: DUF1015 domain-containing protein [Deltaproteobacteria bacterium]|nr:DUF1015 domain-containing protein [Deltaproteobacteria bacterium]
MAEIVPFRGLLYNSEKVGDLAKVMAPPYDVISPKMQDEFYQRHPNNIVRIDLSKAEADDKEGSDKYTRAAAELAKWIKAGVLQRDERPAIYYYTQSYRLSGGVHTRKGFIALSKIEEFGKGRIHAHEQTLSGPKADRLRLMQACDANLSCIFSLYSEPQLALNKIFEKEVKNEVPAVDVVDDNDVENRLWRVDDPDVIRRVMEGMHDKPLFIADGHHRYETAINYRNLMRGKTPDFTGHEPFNYVMMYFSNMDDEGMTIWPTHRVVHGIKGSNPSKGLSPLRGFDPAAFLDECRNYFNVEDYAFTEGKDSAIKMNFLKRIESAGKDASAFGLYMRGVNAYYVLVLKSRDVMEKVFADTIPDVFKNLDVTVLHSLILSKILGITKEAQEKQENLIYVKSPEEALSAVHKGVAPREDANQIAFLLNPTKIEQVKSVALAGHVMPQKSTYFYPKLLTGLVINPLTKKQQPNVGVKL